ncbi:hypothetical protein V8C42DRAFT_336703 [Trichoderma barbatum]
MVFLRCYHQARKLGLTERNARAGWVGLGLWPVNPAKPLLNKLLLLEEEGQPSRPTVPRTPLPIARKRKDPDIPLVWTRRTTKVCKGRSAKVNKTKCHIWLTRNGNCNALCSSYPKGH